ncbi:MAG: M48 family metalloprotease [Phaeodactylibacter sp.]|nr:M48 family metalloprotease [Phaeodactylibacter sp.]MCB9266723.1 M48 family metalloprotease [Lewinellaceae bacterium]MCB9289034.1 M48 family metalloprotease [Lewinellaceae bacterium]
MTLKRLPILAIAFSISLSFSGCSTVSKPGGGFNLFTPAQDIELGQQVAQQIADDPAQFPVLPEKGNEEAYAYIRKIRDKILNTGKVAYKDEFAWEVKIIKDDETLNAFCTPGGHIYVYTGLIKFLDSEDQLAGVMGHEIAHAAQRHSTQQMTKIYGLSALTSIVTGNAEPGLLEQIALGLISLKFSRTHETEADTYSVIFLCPTDYRADGAAGFFRKMEGQPTPPEFLSTHPNPGNRVENIEAEAKKLNCRGTKSYDAEYQRIKAKL